MSTQVDKTESDILEFSRGTSEWFAKDCIGNKANITLHQRAIATLCLALRGNQGVSFTDLRQPW